MDSLEYGDQSLGRSQRVLGAPAVGWVTTLETFYADVGYY